jgi:hypothetical protein
MPPTGLVFGRTDVKANGGKASKSAQQLSPRKDKQPPREQPQNHGMGWTIRRRI